MGAYSQFAFEAVFTMNQLQVDGRSVALLPGHSLAWASQHGAVVTTCAGSLSLRAYASDLFRCGSGLIPLVTWIVQSLSQRSQKAVAQPVTVLKAKRWLNLPHFRT